MKYACMLAATASGSGKTTLTLGMLEAMRKEGKKVRSFKCGPDYIDPLFHQQVLGIPSKNLDLFFSEEDQIRDLFSVDNDSQISLVEGVMGLYDGISPDSWRGSAYHLASVLDLPILLLVDARGMSRSLIALLRGFLEMDQEKRIAGILLNRISPMFYQQIKPVIEAELSVPVVGYYPFQKEGTLTSRYLGLTLPGEVAGLKDQVSQMADILRETLNWEKIYSIMERKVEAWQKKIPGVWDREEKVRIAYALDEAFCFYYEDNLRLLKEAGAELIPFSPIHDQELPRDCQGLILGGGYPELYAEELSRNQTMKESIEAAIQAGMPSLAECGGFMYLHDSITTEQGTYSMLGLLPGTCKNMGHLVRFGYVTIEEKNPCFLPAENAKIRAHEFHYFDTESNGEDGRAVKPGGNRNWEAAFIGQDHWWGFAHLYYPSNPDFPKHFVQCASRRKEDGKLL